MTVEERNQCFLCGADVIRGKPWLILNRVCYGTGRCRASSEFRNTDGAYLWDMDNQPDDELVSGPLLCFPGCVQIFIEGRMLEADIKMGHTE